MFLSFPSFPRTHAGCKGDTQQGLSENTKSGGEACPAHSQQQEDGEGVSHSVWIHSHSNHLHFLSSPLSLLYLPPSLTPLVVVDVIIVVVSQSMLADML